jgi:beta-galactosidase beta subunit
MVKGLSNLDQQRRIAEQVAQICDTLLQQAGNLAFKGITVIDTVDVIFEIQQWAVTNELKADLNENDATVLVVGFKD